MNSEAFICMLYCTKMSHGTSCVINLRLFYQTVQVAVIPQTVRCVIQSDCNFSYCLYILCRYKIPDSCVPCELEAEPPGYCGTSVYPREVTKCKNKHGTCQTVPTRWNGTVSHYVLQRSTEGMESC